MWTFRGFLHMTLALLAVLLVVMPSASATAVAREDAKCPFRCEAEFPVKTMSIPLLYTKKYLTTCGKVEKEKVTEMCLAKGIAILGSLLTPHDGIRVVRKITIDDVRHSCEVCKPITMRDYSTLLAELTAYKESLNRPDVLPPLAPPPSSAPSSGLPSAGAGAGGGVSSLSAPSSLRTPSTLPRLAPGPPASGGLSSRSPASLVPHPPPPRSVSAIAMASPPAMASSLSSPLVPPPPKRPAPLAVARLSGETEHKGEGRAGAGVPLDLLRGGRAGRGWKVAAPVGKAAPTPLRDLEDWIRLVNEFKEMDAGSHDTQLQLMSALDGVMLLASANDHANLEESQNLECGIGNAKVKRAERVAACDSGWFQSKCAFTALALGVLMDLKRTGVSHTVTDLCAKPARARWGEPGSVYWLKIDADVHTAVLVRLPDHAAKKQFVIFQSWKLHYSLQPFLMDETQLCGCVERDTTRHVKPKPCFDLPESSYATAAAATSPAPRSETDPKYFQHLRSKPPGPVDFSKIDASITRLYECSAYSGLNTNGSPISVKAIFECLQHRDKEADDSKFRECLQSTAHFQFRKGGDLVVADT